MWYTYDQNNSGGTFTGPALNVLVEASSTVDADRKAETCGLYFNGVKEGRDCGCCGDRWYRAFEGYSVPSYFGEPLDLSGAQSTPGDRLPRFALFGVDGTVRYL